MPFTVTTGPTAPSGGVGTLSNPSVFIPHGSLTHAVSGVPTTAEISTYASANTLASKVLYYTGTDTATDTVRYAYAVDSAYGVLQIERPDAAVSGTVEALTIASRNAINDLAVAPPGAVSFYVNGVREDGNGITNAAKVITVTPANRRNVNIDPTVDSVIAIY